MFYVIIFINIFIFNAAYTQNYVDINYKTFNNREFKLNEDISPCENFYDYVCSNENNMNTLPQNRHSYVYSHEDAILEINNDRKNYINSILNRKDNSPRGEMIKNYYNSCINEDARKLEEFELIEKYKNQLFKNNKNDLLIKIALDALNGHLYFFNIEESLNSENNKIKDIFFTYELPLKIKSIYYENNAMMEYENIIKLFLKSMNIKNYESMANYIIEFEKSIANIYPSEKNLNEIIMKDKKVNRDFLLNKFPNFYFKYILPKIPNEIKISIIPENAFLHMNLLLEKSTKEELQSLILWYKLSKGEIRYSFPDFYFQKENFKNKYFKNSNLESNIKEKCYLSTIKAFERNLDYELFYSYNKEIPYANIYNLITDLKNTFKKNIYNNKWLSNSAKDHAINKINFIRFEIAKPENMKDWGLEPVLNLSPKKYLKNQIKILQNEFKLMINQINQNANSSKWLYSPLYTSAYYTTNLNKFFIPYGVLKSHILDRSLSDKLDYYLLSITIAHEMSHAFDVNGIEFDAYGNIQSWLSENEKLYFKKELDKMVLLFNTENNDGEITLDENIADLNGLKISYQNHFPDNKKINMNEKRKFFIQYAKKWCGLETEDKYLKEVKKHSFLKLRVNFQMMLSEDFEKTFSCHVNQPMTLKNEQRLFLW